MLYDHYESWRRAFKPASLLAKAWVDTWEDPTREVFPGNWLTAGPELFFRLTKDYEKPAFGIHEVVKDKKTVAVLEQEVDATPFCRLLRFSRLSDDAHLLEKIQAEPSILVVAPLSGHYATLLRDTVRTLLQDHNVYITDWQDARGIPVEDGSFGLDDYVLLLERFMGKLGPSTLHVFAVCQPVVPVLGAISRMSQDGRDVPLSMVLMGGPVDGRKTPTAVNNLATTRPLEWFQSHVIHRVPAPYPGQGRMVYPGFLQHLGFVAMNPSRHAKAHWEFFEDLVRGDRDDAQAHRTFYDEYNAVLDMPAEYYLDTIETVFQRFDLPLGTWRVNQTLVDPSAIRHTALLTIEGERDDIAGRGQTEAAHGLCSGLRPSQHQHLLALGAGHYGLFSGSRWREEIYPVLRAFVQRQNRKVKG